MSAKPRVGLIVIVLLSGSRLAGAQVPCLWDPITGRPVIPQGHERCSTRTPPPSPGPSSGAGRSSAGDEARESAPERRAREKREADIRDAERPYDEGLREWANGNLDKAIDKLRDAVEKARKLPSISPANVALYHRYDAALHRALAMQAARRNDFRTAEEMARRARDADPEDVARADEFETWLAEDRASYERIQKIQNLPGMVDRGEWTAAVDTARALLERYPDSWEFHDALTRGLVGAERWDEAEPALVAQWRLRPNEPRPVRDLAYAAAQRLDFDAAEALLSEVRLLAPGDEKAAQAHRAVQGAEHPRRAEERAARVRAPEAESGRAEWRAQVRTRLEQIDTRNAPPIAPRDFHAGDILLLAPDSAAGRVTAVGDQVMRGEIFRADRGPEVSHAVTFIGRDARGRALFLDNTPGAGPHVIGETEFEHLYAARPTFVARPQTAVDGAELLRYAQDRIRAARGAGRLDTDYGIFGDDLVCSESAGFAVARATRSDLGGLAGGRLGPIDITPADFMDAERAGKFFVVMAMNR